MNVQLESILSNLVIKDQSLRSEFRAGKITLEELQNLDKEITKSFENLIYNHGFPTKEHVSDEAYKSAVVLLLHSSNLKLYELVMETMKNKISYVNKSDIAFITDKYLVLQNRPQRYGTQYKFDTNKTITFLPIENIDIIDRLRLEMNLEPFEECRNKIK